MKRPIIVRIRDNEDGLQILGYLKSSGYAVDPAIAYNFDMKLMIMPGSKDTRALLSTEFKVETVHDWNFKDFVQNFEGYVNNPCYLVTDRNAVEMQKFLFSIGFTWNTGGLHTVDMPFIISHHERLIFPYNQNMAYMNGYSDKDLKLMSDKEFIKIFVEPNKPNAFKENAGYLIHEFETYWGKEIVVMREDGKSSAAVSWWKEDNPGVMQFLYVSVSEDARKQGEGQKLLNMIERLAFRADNPDGETIKQLFLVVEEESWMKGWYGRSGYIIWQKLEGQNAVSMMKFLTKEKHG